LTNLEDKTFQASNCTSNDNQTHNNQDKIQKSYKLTYLRQKNTHKTYG